MPNIKPVSYLRSLNEVIGCVARTVLVVTFLIIICLLASCSNVKEGPGYTGFLEMLTENGFTYRELEAPMVREFRSAETKPIEIWAEGEFRHEFDPNDLSVREEFSAALVRRGLWIYEFGSSELMESSAALVSRDGYSIGNTNYSYIGRPRFYKKDRIIVVYQGENERIISFLEEALGESFAGVSLAS